MGLNSINGPIHWKLLKECARSFRNLIIKWARAFGKSGWKWIIVINTPAMNSKTPAPGKATPRMSPEAPSSAVACHRIHNTREQDYFRWMV